MHTCLHCGNDTPLYCEKCQQELIAKNAELQLKNEELITYCKKCIIIDRLNEYVENSIPKQKIKDKIKEIQKDKHICFGNRNYGKTYKTIKIQVLKELLGE